MRERSRSYMFRLAPISLFSPNCCPTYVQLTIKDDYGKVVMVTTVRREDYSVFDLYLYYSTRLIGEPAPQINNYD